MTTWVFPGQGSQYPGMGKGLFDELKELVSQADGVLGYSIAELCLLDPNGKLKQTEYTQPAIYTVNALHYFKRLMETGKQPDFVAGHSLGEYNALLAAGAFDFATGLQLVQRRARLMSKASSGAMAAILQIPAEEIAEMLAKAGLVGIDIANYNTPSQTVISGLSEDIQKAAKVFEKSEAQFAQINVSGAFHSRHMTNAAEEFRNSLQPTRFSELQIPVIANVDARAYAKAKIADNLVSQIHSPVRWVETIQYLMTKGEVEFIEVGPGQVLTRLVNQIKQETKPEVLVQDVQSPRGEVKQAGSASAVRAENLGSEAFRQRYNLKHAYLSGAMVKGIASTDLVIKMGKAGLMGFFGTGGVRLPEIEEAIICIQGALASGQAYGMNFLHSPDNLEREDEVISLYLRYGIRTIEAAAFMQMTPALVKYRLKGLKPGPAGKVVIENRIIAKISRPEVAQLFLSPPPEKLVRKLLQEQEVTAAQADLAKRIPMADDLCVESDSAGHTDMGIMSVVLPTIIRLRNELVRRQGYVEPVGVGAAGGIGTPEAAASAFTLGADFILTGSINQCTVEAGTSEAAKNLLQQINVQDTDYAPAGDMFELGAKIQVVRKGLFFPARANKLFELYRQHHSWEEIDIKTRTQIQEKYFRRSFDEVYSETKAYYLKTKASEIEKAENNPKHKMALVFRWYFIHSMRLAMHGSTEQKVDYQIHCGPALGAFNQWVKGTELESWQKRHVDVIAEKLMNGTAEYLDKQMQRFGMSHRSKPA
jgi:trans-AT polyketide synthase/acyltransferase/oxidoreductase domain-containing protein